jgi:hypothetical protein
MQTTLGMWCVHDGSFADDRARVDRLASLVVDPRWVYRFRLITVDYLPQLPPEPRFAGFIAPTAVREDAVQAFMSPSAASVMFHLSERDADAHANFDVQTGRQQIGLGTRSNAHWRVPASADPDEVTSPWVELQHAIIDTLGAKHAVLVTATNEYVLNAEVWLSLTRIDGQWMHRRPSEIRAYEAHRHDLGDAFVRRPRWGTYLNRAHVAAIGGRQKILDVVQPPVTRDVGELFYVQLSGCRKRPRMKQERAARRLRSCSHRSPSPSACKDQREMQVESVDALRAAIEAAWQDAQYPGDRHVSAGYDNEDLVRSELMGKHWRDVNPAFAKPFAYGDNLELLDPAALAFFLPAFLLIDVDTGDMPLVNALAPRPRDSRNPDNLDKFWARVDALTEEQKSVIARLFTYWRAKEWIADSDRDAVVEYWAPYLGVP